MSSYFSCSGYVHPISLALKLSSLVKYPTHPNHLKNFWKSTKSIISFAKWHSDSVPTLIFGYLSLFLDLFPFFLLSSCPHLQIYPSNYFLSSPLPISQTFYTKFLHAFHSAFDSSLKMQKAKMYKIIKSSRCRICWRLPVEEFFQEKQQQRILHHLFFLDIPPSSLKSL